MSSEFFKKNKIELKKYFDKKPSFNIALIAIIFCNNEFKIKRNELINLVNQYFHERDDYFFENRDKFKALQDNLIFEEYEDTNSKYKNLTIKINLDKFENKYFSLIYNKIKDNISSYLWGNEITDSDKEICRIFGILESKKIVEKLLKNDSFKFKQKELF